MSDHTLAHAVRFLAIDAVEKASSGHPGMPMGMADIAQVLWRKHLNVNPRDPHFPNRDRFVLSNGHGSMLLYALLHLTGFDVSLDDLKKFRSFKSKTPGHPEVQDTPGVETTTGPLGQGLANAVGMALAERVLASTFNKPHVDIVDHYTYVFVGDGCLMEGVSHEACALAGTLGLGKLIVFWDDNGISIDGEVAPWFAENVADRFKAYGFQVLSVDGHCAANIDAAIVTAKADTKHPTLICAKTHIGFGSPNKSDSASAHGSPLGKDERAATATALNWPYAPFVVPEDIQSAWCLREKGADLSKKWRDNFAAYQREYPELAAEFERRVVAQVLPENFAEMTRALIEDSDASEKMATRKASQKAINAFAPLLPELLGGSADLTGSNNTNWSGTEAITPECFSGNYLHYGVREFGMAAIMNGLALHGGFIPYGGTFLVFSDYARNAIRMSALMSLHVIYVLTHDSIGLGEDGPTHQPVEHAASLRLIPGLMVWRPCDVLETMVAWQQALLEKKPHCLLLTRQALPDCHGDSHANQALIARGGYVLWEPEASVQAIIMATGSEVTLALQAAKQLAEKNIAVRVVSMPCVERFKAQDKTYRDSVLLSQVEKRVAIEAGVSDTWHQFVGLAGEVIGLDRFGMSAPANKLFDTFGFTVEAVVSRMNAFFNQ